MYKYLILSSLILAGCTAMGGAIARVLLQQTHTLSRHKQYMTQEG